MNYISTRGQSEPRTFIEAVKEGLARDGGLLVPETIPDFSNDLERLSTLSYQDLAAEIFAPFINGEIPSDRVNELISKSYETFESIEITPLIFQDKLAILELFHGPTLAFKDVALQFLGNLFEEILRKDGSRLNILGATSGDTGSAAIHGVRGKNNIHIFMIHPQGKVSPIQEKQMTTVLDENVHNLAIKGTFDDAQRAVKEVFNDLDFRDTYQLGAVNSINWARVMAQIVYYFYAAFIYMNKLGVRTVSFSVPTGNFGDIYAGYLAKKMGLPIEKLILATNENDILYRTIESGTYKISDVHATISPSMDIQIASNFERFVFDISGRDGDIIQSKMDDLANNGEFSLSEDEVRVTRDYFLAARVDTRRTLDTMKKYKELGIELDPHTAVGVAAAEESGIDHVIALATAHPAKFGEAVKKATGASPEYPASLKGILEKESRCQTVENSYKAIESIIEETLERL